MKLQRFVLKNFRGYKEAEIDFHELTTLVGINDAGKSTIFEALDIFFGNTKFDISDKNILVSDNVELIAYFTDLPDFVQLETVNTNLKNEYLTNEGQLVIKKVYQSGTKISEYIVSKMPDVKGVEEIHTTTIDKLRITYKKILDDSVDKRVSAEIRQQIFQSMTEKTSKLAVKEIDLKKGEGKNLSVAIHKELPMYQLFKVDRENSDSDSEIQTPIKAIVKSTLANNADLKKQLDDVFEAIVKEASKTTESTLELLQEMNPELTNVLNANFDMPKWETVFKSSVSTDENISLNKRGSGIRRLVLLNFFRAEAERQFNQQSNIESRNLIYAFEEPETALHPKYQRMLLDSFQEMVEKQKVQVMITTHSPAIAKSVPAQGVRLIQRTRIGEATIDAGENAIQKVVQELGLLPDLKLYDDQLKIVVFVEGPTDVQYFERLFEMLSEKTPEQKRKVAFMFGGGTTVVKMLNLKYLDQLNLDKKIAIVDGDESGQVDLSKMSDDVVKLSVQKSTIEFYLPYELVKSTMSKSAQLKFNTTQEEWNTGKNEYKLRKNEKTHLANHNVYSSFSIEELSEDDITEMTNIVRTIDEYL